MVSPGELYISKPTVEDPYFKDSILLISESDYTGAIGFIINKPLKLVVNELRNDLDSDNPVFYGGPVKIDTLHYFHNFEGISSSVKIANGVYWGGDFDEVKLLAKLKVLNETNIKFFVGYTGWTKEAVSNNLTGENSEYRRFGKIEFEDFFLNNLNSTDNWSNSYLKIVGYKQSEKANKNEVLEKLNNCKHLLSQNRISESLNLIIENQGFQDSNTLSHGILIDE